MRSLEKQELKELLNKCWMTHDAMWFSHCLEECGIEKTNRINRAAAKSVGMIEVKRIKKALGIGEIQSFEDLKKIAIGAYEIVKGDFMHITPSFSSDNILHWEWETKQCFAHDGIKKLGVIDQYQCGIFERIGGWFDGLGIKYSITPQVEGCMLHSNGKCFRDFRFYF